MNPTATTGSMSLGGEASAAMRELEQMNNRELEQAFLRGVTPEPASLVGWQFRGTNVPGWARVLGIKKFMKGFFERRDRVYGYNVAVTQDSLLDPWSALPTNNSPKPFGFYLVTSVSPTSRDNAYLHSVLLNYGLGGNSKLDPTSGLRDYVVQVSPNNPDLYLGKAYYALGNMRVATNFFILERDRQGPRTL